MSEPQRYEASRGGMVPVSDGAYVDYEAYERLRTINADLIQAIRELKSDADRGWVRSSFETAEDRSFVSRWADETLANAENVKGDSK